MYDPFRHGGYSKDKNCDCLTKANQSFLDEVRSCNILAHKHRGQEVWRIFGPVCVRCCLHRAFHLAAKWQEWHFLMMLKQTESNLVSRLSTNLLRITHACNIATYKVLGLALQTARGTKYLCNMGWLGAISIKEIWKPTTERSVKGENLDVPIRAKINSTKWKRVSNRCTDVTTYFGDSMRFPYIWKKSIATRTLHECNHGQKKFSSTKRKSRDLKRD